MIDHYREMKYIDYTKYNGKTMIQSAEGRYLIPAEEVPQIIKDKLHKKEMTFIAERNYDIGIKMPEDCLLPCDTGTGHYLLSVLTITGPDDSGIIKTFYTVGLTNGKNVIPMVLAAGVIDDE